MCSYVHGHMANTHTHTPALNVIAVVLAPLLLPALFMAVMVVIKSLNSSSPVTVYSLVVPSLVVMVTGASALGHGP